MPAGNLWHNWGVLDYHRHSVSFVPESTQARFLVEHHLPSVGWAALYREAALKAYYADHGSASERWFRAIVSEMELRVVGAALAGALAGTP